MDAAATTEIMDIRTGPSYAALIENDKPIVVLEGSTRSAKTWDVLLYLCPLLSERKLVCFCGRHDGTTCEKTVIRDFKEVMGLLETWDDSAWNSTLKQYVWPNGSIMDFGGTQDAMKLHGRKQDILWLNEAMEISYDAWKQLNQRTTWLRILDYNPSLTHHWIFDRVLTRGPREVTYCHSTYKDNLHLAPEQVREIESFEPTEENKRRGTADEWHWTVYGLGKRGRREGVVFKLWSLTEDWPDRMQCQRYGYGLDLGFSLDPTTVIECALFQDDLYLRELVWETGLLVTRNISQPSEPSLDQRMEAAGVDKTVRIHAESAKPECLRDLELCGYNMVPTVKTPDSILHGLDLMKRRRLRVHIASQNLQRELENYVWKQQKSTGAWLNEPVDAWNHGIDAARYWALGELRASPEHTSRPSVATSVLNTGARAPRVRIVPGRAISVLHRKW